MERRSQREGELKSRKWEREKKNETERELQRKNRKKKRNSGREGELKGGFRVDMKNQYINKNG